MEVAHKALLLLSCLLVIRAATSADLDPNWKSFSDPLAQEYLTLLVVVHNVTGDVFLASPDNLYHLDADLVLKKKVVTGPRSVCSTPDCRDRSVEKYIPYSMTVAYHLDALVMCGSLYDGACEVRPLRDLNSTSWIGPDGDEVSRCTAAIGDPSFFVGNTFFSGADHMNDDDKPPEKKKNFISSKQLLRKENGEYMFKYTHEAGSTRSAITFRSDKNQIILYSFTYESYVYFLFFRSDRSKMSTVLARICLDDPTFHSYTEQPLSCKKGDKEYIVPSSAYLGPLNPSNPTAKSLYVAFYRTKDSAVVCDFDMSLLNGFFKMANKDCYKGDDSSYLINLDNGTHSPCKIEPYTDDQVFCGSNINPYIYHEFLPFGRLGLVVNIPDFQILSLAVFVEKNATVLFIGAKPAVFAKMVYGKSSGLHADHAGGSAIQRSSAFDLKREHIYFLASSKIIKYPIMSCSIYLTCKDCFRADDDPLQCGWCNGRCSQLSECTKPEAFSRNKCSPTIYKVEPLRGPSEGGTHVTIEGINFGPQNRTKPSSLVWVAGTQCRVLLWEDQRILCITTASSSDRVGVVEVNVRDSPGSFPFMYQGSAESNETFTFISPRLFGIVPDRGSISGGTNVTLYGRNLKMGLEHKVNIRGRICTNLRVENDSATCITGRSKDISLPDTIEMKVGDRIIRITDDDSPNAKPVSKNFEYLFDPEIYKIHPLNLLLSYRGNITVTGRYLESVKEPKMVVNRIESNGFLTKYEQNCRHTPNTDGTIMMCSLSVMGRNILELLNPTTDRKPALETVVTFSMFPFKSPEVQSPTKLKFYHDPWYEPFPKAQKIVTNQTHLEIKGIFPEPVNLTEFIRIRIGESGVCKLSDFTWDTLRCKLSPEFTTNSSIWGDHLSIQVQTASEWKNLGYLVIEAPPKPEEPAEMSTAVVAVIVAVIIVLCIGSFVGIWWGIRRCLLRNKLRGFSSPIGGSVTFINDYRPVASRHQALAENVPAIEDSAARFPLVRSFSREPSTSTTTSLISRTPSREPSIITTASRLSRAASIEPSTSTTTRTPPVVPDMTSAAPVGAIKPPGYLSMKKSQNGNTVPKMIQPLQPVVANPHPIQQASVEQEQARYLEETIGLLKLYGILLERERLTILEIVGAGQFGYVCEGVYNCPKQGSIQVAVKAIRDNPELKLNTVKEFLDEGIKMKDFHHENVVNLIGICFDNRVPVIVTPYMENGDLCGYLRYPHNELLLADLRKFAIDAAAGMSYLALYKYVHRDLAARNCLLDSDMKLKIADFGMSRDVYESEYYRAESHKILPVKWMAPESLDLGVYTVKSDVWSYGVLLWEIFTRGVLPYEETHNWALLESIKNGLRLPKPQRCSKKLYRIMTECWQMDPEKRPEFDTLYNVLMDLSQKISYNERLLSVPAQNKEYDECE